MRRLLSRLFPRRTPCVFDPTAMGWRDIEGRPGVATSYTMLVDGQHVRAVDASCPGCGQARQINPVTHPVVGPDQAMTCLASLEWSCCGWIGRLESGVWIGR